jgi:hypothetical protein
MWGNQFPDWCAYPVLALLVLWCLYLYSRRSR